LETYSTTFTVWGLILRKQFCFIFDTNVSESCPNIIALNEVLMR